MALSPVCPIDTSPASITFHLLKIIKATMVGQSISGHLIIFIFTLALCMPSCSPAEKTGDVGDVNHVPRTIKTDDDVFAWITTTGLTEASCTQANSLAQEQGTLLVACFRDRFSQATGKALLRYDSTAMLHPAQFNPEHAILMRALSIEQKALSETSGLFIMVRHPVADFDKWAQVFKNMEYYKELDSIYTIGVFRDLSDSLSVSVLSYSASEEKAARYAKLLDQGRILEASGVKEPIESQVLQLIAP